MEYDLKIEMTVRVYDTSPAGRNPEVVRRDTMERLDAMINGTSSLRLIDWNIISVERKET